MKKALCELLSLTSLGMAGLAATTATAADTTVPANYRAQIVGAMKYKLVDAYSVRDAQISAPLAVAYHLGHVPGVCFRFNAKNQYGAYSGFAVWVAGWHDGKIDVGPAVRTKCDDGVWQPFPELNGKS